MANARISARVGTLLSLAVILAVNVWGSLHWIRSNVVLIGNDASGYLSTTLEISTLLQPLNLQTLFQAVTLHDYRPPALFLTAQPFLAVLGPSMDAAQLATVLIWLPAVLLLTFLLGRAVADNRTGLIAAGLVGLLPMMSAMARLFYTEMLLTATVTLSLLALLKSQGFVRRNWSIVWGVSIGLGLLVKWTMPIYLWLPLLLCVARADWRPLGGGARPALGDAWRLRQRDLLLALVGGLLLAGFWVWPNRALTTGFPLENFLLVGWTLIVGATIYLVLAPSAPSTNLAAALAVAVAVASLWYLPHADFASHLLYYDEVRGDRSAGPLNLDNYLRYFRHFYHFHMGALSFWLVVPAALLPWVQAIGQRRTLNRQAAYLWLSILAGYIVLVLIQQQNARNLVPVLPAMAILAAIALLSYSRPVAVALGTVWVVVLGLQWAIFTFDRFAPLYAQAPRLWATVDYAAPPAVGVTDPDYWIGPRILATVTEQAQGIERLGMLVNTRQLHRGTLKYLIAAGQLPVEIKDLTESTTRGMSDLLSAPWLLVQDGDLSQIEAPGRELLARIQAGDPLFDALYKEVARYPLPSGETVTLFHRSQGPGRPLDLPLQVEATQAVAETIRRNWSDQATLVYANPDLAVWVGIHDPARERVIVLPPGQDPAPRLDALEGTLFIVQSHDTDAVQEWSRIHGDRTFEVGDDFASVAIYGRHVAALTEQLVNGQPVTATWPFFQLTGLATSGAVVPGGVLAVGMTGDGDFSGAYKKSVRLLDREGNTIAEHDRPLAAADRFGLLVPPTTPPGSYDLVMYIYATDTVENQPDTEGASPTALLIVDIDVPPTRAN